MRLVASKKRSPTYPSIDEYWTNRRKFLTKLVQSASAFLASILLGVGLSGCSGNKEDSSWIYSNNQNHKDDGISKTNKNRLYGWPPPKPTFPANAVELNPRRIKKDVAHVQTTETRNMGVSPPCVSFPPHPQKRPDEEIEIIRSGAKTKIKIEAKTTDSND